MSYCGMTLLRCFVPGVPVAQGSLASNGRGQLYYSNASKLNPWRKNVQAVAEAFRDRQRIAYEGPVGVTAWFYVPRPKTVKREYPIAPSDLDKYIRAIGDSLTKAQIYKDDGQVIDWITRKRYADEDHPIGVLLEVYTDDFAN